MKLSRLGLGLILLALLISTSGCGWINSIRSKSQLNEAVSSFKDKNYDVAEKYARKAIDLDPNSENARVILAIVLQTEYRRGDPSESNRKRAEEAIDLYKQIAQKNPNSEQGDTAFAAVTKLLSYLSQSAADQADKLAADNPDEAAKLREEQKRLDAEQLDWIRQRAQNESLSKEKRAEAYAILANRDLLCSQAVTGPNQQHVKQPNGDVFIEYKKPSDPNDFDKASKCVTEGLDLAKAAIDLDPQSESAYEQRWGLLLEAKHLANMQGDKEKEAQYNDQANEASRIGTDLHNKAKAAATPTPAT